MGDPRGILVLAEVQEGGLETTSREVVSAGLDLAQQTGEPLAIGLAGDGLDHAAEQAASMNVATVYVMDSVLLGQHPDLVLAALNEMVRTASPRIVLMGRTQLGRDLAPKLAFRLEAGLVHDCVEVRWDGSASRLLGNRPVFGGNAMATVASVGTPQMAALRPRAYPAAEPDPSHQAEVVSLSTGLDESQVRVKIVERRPVEADGPILGQAKVVVAGGRGIGGPEPFNNELRELAEALGGAVGASRPPADLEWVPSTYHIGLTGRTLAADLYVAIGISGANQHLAGVSGCKAIIAINQDPEANIFKVARFGLVGTWQKTLPAFTQAVKELQNDSQQR